MTKKLGPVVFTHKNWHGALTVQMGFDDLSRLRVTRSGVTRDGVEYGYGMDLETADIVRLRDYLTEALGE